MDARLRILLRRYTASHDPEDAVAFVNNYLRSFEGEALDEIQVWMVHQVSADDEITDHISLHTSAYAAYMRACILVNEAIENEQLTHYDELPAAAYDWVGDFEELVEHNAFVQAHQLYQERIEQWAGHGFPDIEVEEISVDESS